MIAGNGRVQKAYTFIVWLYQLKNWDRIKGLILRLISNSPGALCGAAVQVPQSSNPYPKHLKILKHYIILLCTHLLLLSMIIPSNALYNNHLNTRLFWYSGTHFGKILVKLPRTTKIPLQGNGMATISKKNTTKAKKRKKGKEKMKMGFEKELIENELSGAIRPVRQNQIAR